MASEQSSAETEQEYWVIQENGFNSGYIESGPYAKFTEAFRKKKRLEADSPVRYQVHEGEP